MARTPWIQAYRNELTPLQWWGRNKGLGLRTIIKRLFCRHVLSMSHWRHASGKVLDLYCPKCGEVTHYIDTSSLPEDKAAKIMVIMGMLRFNREG